SLVHGHREPPLGEDSPVAARRQSRCGRRDCHRQGGQADGSSRAGSTAGGGGGRWAQRTDDRCQRLRCTAAGRDVAGVRREAVNLLLDTQALLWWREAARRLGRRARQAIEEDAATVSVSAASLWEIAIKSQVGRLKLRDPIEAWPEALAHHGFA